MKYFLYNHIGSANHGCEALVRSVLKMLPENAETMLLSEMPDEEIYYRIQDVTKIIPATCEVEKKSMKFLRAYLQLKIRKNFFPIDALPYEHGIDRIPAGAVGVSIGGDVFCYDNYPKYILIHEQIRRRKHKTILMGCSLEEELFQDPAFIKDMKNYDYILARESLTFELLKRAGITKIGLAPDPAFTLPEIQLPMSEKFAEGNTIGINVSPLVERRETKKGIVLENYKTLIRNILSNTDCSVALIPHVVWKDNDDRMILKKIYDLFRESGRVVMINDHNCMELKGYISRCRFFIGARTHATIAAYSTGIPTLTLGYSIKSRGIAKDLFGTDENYVIPVQRLSRPEDLWNAFEWIWKHEKEIKSILHSAMPDYIERAKQTATWLKEI